MGIYDSYESFVIANPLANDESIYTTYKDQLNNLTNCIALEEEVLNLMNTLTPKEQLVLSLRFGFGCGTEMTYEQIGKKIGKSHETARQIVVKALDKLRQSERVHSLKEFV